MQCVNCQFENMPGTQLCVRCGASLQIALASVNIHPPRASKRQKALRRWLPLRNTYFPLRSWFVSTRQSIGAVIARDLHIKLPPPAALARMFLPGWAHSYLGYRDRGHIFTYAWLACVFIGLLVFGSTVGAIALGLAFAVHAASILDLLMQVNEICPRTLTIVTALTFTILLAVYVPAGRAVAQFVSSRQLIRTSEPFVPGDVVLFRPRAYETTLPQAGDVVLYRNTPFRAVAPNYLWHRAFYQIDGEWADRVIAGPDSTVRCDNGKLFVDGEPSPYLPLNPERLPSTFAITVPHDACCIVPTTNPYLPEATGTEGLQSNYIVPRSHLVGKVIARNYPIWRWWWVR